MHFVKMITLKEKLIRFMIYVDNVQLYICADLQRKYVMLHIGPNLIILYLSFKEYILTKIILFAIHNT